MVRCALCGEEMLELTGQMMVLRGYQVVGDDELATAGPVGPVHVSCLIASRWGPRWAASFRRYGLAINQVELGRAGEVTATLHPPTQEVTLIRDDGYRVVVSRRELRDSRPVTGGVVVQLDEEYNLELPGRSALVQDIRKALMMDKQVPLSSFLARLGSRARLAFPEALEGSVLRYDKGLARYWIQDWLSMRLQYGMFVPQDGVELVP